MRKPTDAEDRLLDILLPPPRPIAPDEDVNARGISSSRRGSGCATSSMPAFSRARRRK